MQKDYKCSICGKHHVKLWRPYMGTYPLICASCAEQRQSPKEYDEKTWIKKNKGYVGIPTGNKLPLEKWAINSEGLIPSYEGPGPTTLPLAMTDQLIVDLRDVSENHSSGETTIVPAVPDKNGEFWSYTSVPEKDNKWWKELPTH